MVQMNFKFLNFHIFFLSSRNIFLVLLRIWIFYINRADQKFSRSPTAGS